MDYEITDAPEGLENAIIYEIAAKNFTSPNGAESGTFSSMEEKIPYLANLGINVIWLSGHQLCRRNHFYNIWTEYACIRPDRLDPDLGTEGEFKHMIDSAHRHGIKVILDVITHGVMKDSPLVKEHPDWFRGESWEMKDFDWYGGHQDLDDWWVNTWLWYIREFGIDGYRLDVAHYRSDLWAVIRRKAVQEGRKILIAAESGPAIKGVTDILQHGEVISHNYGLNRSSRILWDAAGYIKDRQLRAGEHYNVKIYYEDGTVQDSGLPTWYQEMKVPEVIYEKDITRIIKYESCSDGPIQTGSEMQTGRQTGSRMQAGIPAGIQMQTGILRVENIYGEKAIRNIQIRDKQGQIWNSRREDALEVDYKAEYQRKHNGLLVEFPLRIQDGQFLSIQLSCHDNGWDGFPLEENPYGVQGSRYLAGYTALLAPGIPVFMSGEEFNADYRPLPGLSPKLFGGEMFGKGRWLYGSWLDWEQLENPEKAEMLDDVKLMIRIRKTYSGMVHAFQMGETKPCFGTIDYESTAELPIPYFYRKEGRVLAVCANPDSDKDVSVCLKLQAVLHGSGSWQAEVLFGELPEACAQIAGTAEELDRIRWNIKRDKSRQGGLLVLAFKKEKESGDK